MNRLLYCAGSSPALEHAVRLLKDAGFSFAQAPDAQVTHLLLPVPSFAPNGFVKGGGDIQEVLAQLSADITVIGGNLNVPALSRYNTVDLLQQPQYLATNAAITAHCAIKEALCRMDFTFAGCPVLVIGWGRIGKCLAKLLKGLDAQVTVAARKEADRAMLIALGYHAIPIINMDPSPYRVIFNTVPVMVLHHAPEALKIELASKPGIAGEDVVLALGLPGKDAPESSGALIAQTLMRKGILL